jgi:biotin transport system substrate-specific component
MRTRELVTAALMAALTAAGALIAIPITPVPVTLQVLFVLMAGLVLRPGAAVASMAVYISLGVAGLPVFSGGKAGLQTLLGPTGGYLMGFMAAALFVSLTAGPGSGRSGLGWRALAVAAGIAAIYAVGVMWLATQTGMSVTKAFAVGALPFIPIDALKGVLAVAGAQALERVGVLEAARQES